VIYFCLTLDVLNRILDNILIPKACQKSITRTPSNDGTKQLFHSHIVGKAMNTPMNTSASTAPNHVPIILIDLFSIVIFLVLQSPRMHHRIL